jgi:hypothetical protein
MRIVDCFPYFNEKELLELRIKLLYDKVDQFIITDANRTHSGQSKPFTCIDTIKELGISQDKITVVKVNLPSFEDEPSAWVRERIQRNVAAEYLQKDDICIATDCDEIIDPDFIDYYVNIAKQHPYNILRIPMAFLMGRADLRAYDTQEKPWEWDCPFICNTEHLKHHTISNIRESRSTKSNSVRFTDIFATDDGVVKEAGWHFSWMGDTNRRKIKQQSYSHWNEYKILDKYNPEEGSTDPLGRQDHILKKYSIGLLPDKIFELDHIKQFLLPGVKMQHFYNKPQFGEEWFSYPNLYARMVERFPSQSKFVEVGSWKGRSAACMCVEIANSEKKIDFYCVDTWEGSVEHQGYDDLEKLYDIFLRNMKPVEKYYFPLKIPSLDAVHKFEDKSLDFVFLDGSHEYEDVVQDIIAWMPKIKKGGILAGHDYYPNNPEWFGVNKAVDEIFTDFEKSEDCWIVNL